MFEQSYKYVFIVYLLWQAVSNCSRKIGAITESNPTMTDNTFVDWCGMKLIRCSFPRVEGIGINYTNEEIQEMLNLELQYVLLPEQNILNKFRLDDGYYSQMEPLYVHEVRIEGTNMYVDVLFIDNTLAYETARHRENEIALQII